ncbi:MAG: DUF1127 domain-containing protein [Bosea sp. (in: a-proteobacteria)]
MLIMTLAAKFLASKPFTVAAKATVGPVSFLVTQGKQLLRARRHRREVQLMSELTPRDLKDIGLVPSDVSGALAVHWSDDPSKVLVLRRPVPEAIGGSIQIRSSLRPDANVKPTSIAPDCGDLCLPRPA